MPGRWRSTQGWRAISRSAARPAPCLNLGRVALPPTLGHSPGAAPLDPLALFALAPSTAPRFYWSAAEGDLAIAAFGAARTVTAEGPDRFAKAEHACSVIQSQISWAEDDPTLVEPRFAPWLGGFAFQDRPHGDGVWADFPATAFTLPEVTLVVHRERVRLLVAGPEDRPALLKRAESVRGALVAGTGPPRGSAPAEGASPSTATPSSGADAAGNTHGEAVASPLRSSIDPDAAWADLRGRIERAVDAIRRGEADKAVLATARSVATPRPLDPLALLARLRARQPGCFHFMLSPRPGLAFLGASPERLVRVRGDRLTTMALAGSARRSADAREDAALGRALLASPKDRAEHALVVAAIGEALRDYRPDMPAQPRLRRLATIQHLETPISARLPGQGKVLSEAARLHPTPALGGTPRAAALGLIRRIEGFDRGWYAGGVGWIDGRGNGDLAVAIRSLLVGPRSATAFAGAGLVAASEPDTELAEIQLKLGAMLTLVDAEVLNSA